MPGRIGPAVVLALAAWTAASPSYAAPIASRVQLANRCVAFESLASRRFVAIADGETYRAAERLHSRATGFHLKPTGLGTYVLHDPQGRMPSAEPSRAVGRTSEPGPPAEWRLTRAPERSFTIESTGSGLRVAAGGAGDLSLTAGAPSERSARFRLTPARGCLRFPEAEVGASGRPRRLTARDGTIFGFGDAHLHITSDLRAGGRVIHGTAFDRFGISRALGGDEVTHGPDGSLDVTGNLLRSGSPVGTHDTQGWPGFGGWPVHDTYTHQQVYYLWLKRAWMAGMRLAVAQAIEDEPLCRIEPFTSHSCDETETIKLAIARLRALEEYVDSQSGGRGRGWFRLVHTPRDARRVMERGKLAVVIGMETSSPLGCSELLGAPQCTRADIDRRLDELHALGVRSLFVAHWTDNAFGGAALQSGANGIFIGAMQVRQTGLPFATEACTRGDEADGRCNVKGLTGLGRHLIERMIAKGMLIEVDHLSQKARESVLTIAEANRYPLISSHTHTGGEWTPDQLQRLYALGGFATATPDVAPAFAQKVVALRAHRGPDPLFGVGIGSDTGGFASLPPPRDDAARSPLAYPFASYGGGVRFDRQRTGTRVFDLNTDGVAHYGLFADLLADVQRQPGGGVALRALFSSAEAYLRTWERATGARPRSPGG